MTEWQRVCKILTDLSGKGWTTVAEVMAELEGAYDRIEAERDEARHIAEGRTIELARWRQDADLPDLDPLPWKTEKEA